MMRVIRQSSLAETPWKNGGGTTREAVRVPAVGPFRWRVSLARIDASGPFSDFSGYTRKMVLLQGAGVRLTFADGAQSELREIGAMAEFDGEVATQCDLLGGACSDLNLIASKAMRAVRAGSERLLGARVLDPPRGGTSLVFAISGCVSIECGVHEPIVLEPWDLAVVSREGDAPAPATVTAVGDAPLVFFAALDDNSP